MWKKAGHRIAKTNKLKNRKLLRNVVSVVNFTVTGNNHTMCSKIGLVTKIFIPS